MCMGIEPVKAEVGVDFHLRNSSICPREESAGWVVRRGNLVATLIRHRLHLRLWPARAYGS